MAEILSEAIPRLGWNTIYWGCQIYDFITDIKQIGVFAEAQLGISDSRNQIIIFKPPQY